MWKTAPQRLRPTRPPARPASASSSSGRPSALASLGQSADILWLAGHTGLAFTTQAQAAALQRIKTEGKKVKSWEKASVSTGWS